MYSCFYGVAWLATTRCADLRGSVSFISSFALGFRARGVCPRGLAYDSGFCDQVKAKLVNITSKNYGFMMVFGAIIALNSCNELVYNDIHIITYTYTYKYYNLSSRSYFIPFKTVKGHNCRSLYWYMGFVTGTFKTNKHHFGGPTKTNVAILNYRV
jgi:hypothetical protein